MRIEKNGIIPQLTFKDLNGGEAFYHSKSEKQTLMMKGFQFQGIGQCAINLSNGAVCKIEDSVPVTRVDAKVVIE